MVDVEFDQGLAVLTIDRPHARNAISLDTMDQLEKALDAAEGASALAITGADAAGAQPRSKATGYLFDVAECPRPWPYRRICPKPRIRGGVQSTGQHLPQGLAGPPARTLISGDQFSGNIAHWLKAPIGETLRSPEGSNSL